MGKKKVKTKTQESDWIKTRIFAIDRSIGGCDGCSECKELQKEKQVLQNRLNYLENFKDVIRPEPTMDRKHRRF